MSVSVWQRIGAAVIAVCLAQGLAAQEPETLTVSPKVAFPSADEVADLLKREPLTLENWPIWRGRLSEWINDRGQGTDPAFDAARKFVHAQLDAKGELPPALAKDNLAIYLLAKAYFFDTAKDADHKAAVIKAENALRESLKLDAKFPQAHRDLAMVLIHREDIEPSPEPGSERFARLAEAIKELQEAAKLDPTLPMAHVKVMAAKLAYQRDQYTVADVLFSDGLREAPALAAANLKEAALAILLNTERDYVSTIIALDKLGKEFPTSGLVAALHGTALFGACHTDAALAEFARAKRLGTDPAAVVPPKAVAGAGFELLKRKDIEWPAAKSSLTSVMEVFPENGSLVAFHGYSLFATGDAEGAIAEFARARLLGADPNTIKGLNVKEIETTWLLQRSQRWFGWSVLGLLGFYLALMGLMALVGQRFSGAVVAAAPKSAGAAPAAALAQPLPSAPSKPYLAVLIGAALLFYAAVVLLLAVLIAAAAGLLFFIFNAPTVPFSLVCALVVIVVLCWVYLSTIFTWPRRERVGIPVAPEESGRLRQVVDEVGKQLEADPVAEIRLSPGADVRIWPQNRGPFGIFGGARRLLTVGYAALRYLSVGELQALLARQFALCTRRDPRAVRFVALAHDRIEQTLDDMRQEGGKGSYINPFFIFLNLYGQAFSLLAAGFTRWRILRADQEAAKLQGSGTLINALMKANVDAILFAARSRQLAEQLLPEAPDLSNVYAAWDELCTDRGSKENAKATDTSVQEKTYRHLAIGIKDRDRMWEKTVALPGLGGQPGMRERLDLLGKLPKSEPPDDTCAAGLIDNVESLEEELTEMLTKEFADRKEN
jgi:Zn-dependent protease with chaperone function